MPGTATSPRTAPLPAREDGQRTSDLLRRTDWRFLLPDPNPVRVRYQGDAADSLLMALHRVCGEVDIVRRNEASMPSRDRRTRYDLAVFQDPSLDDVRGALPDLGPDAWLYIEMRRRPFTRRRFTSADLERLGLEDIREHWHDPDFERCRRILPAERVQPLRFFSRNKLGGVAPRAAPVVHALCRVAGIPLGRYSSLLARVPSGSGGQA